MYRGEFVRSSEDVEGIFVDTDSIVYIYKKKLITKKYFIRHLDSHHLECAFSTHSPKESILKLS